jgi:hypothetical protein
VNKVRFFTLSFFLFSLAVSNTLAKRDTIKFEVKRIAFDNSFRTDTFPVDTSIFKIHSMDPTFLKGYSYTYLSRFGYPLESNVGTERLEYRDVFLPANSFLPYIQDSRYNFFFNTNKPFTSLTYKTSGNSQDKEDFLQVLHTQNPGKKVNFGVLYNNYSCFSRYDIQKSSDHVASFFFRYTGTYYNNYSLFYLNSFTIQENGGIKADSSLDYVNGTVTGMDVNLQKATSVFKRIGFNSLNELKFSCFASENDDSTSERKKDYGSLVYNFNYEKNKRQYTDQNTDFYYGNYHNGTDYSSDSVVINKLSNKVLLNSPDLSKYLPNLRLALTHDVYFQEFSTPADTFFYNRSTITHISNKTNFSSTWWTVDISQKFRQFWWHFIWDSYFLGYGIGDQSIKSTIKMFADKKQSIALTMRGTWDLKTPSYFYDSYYSNHYIWFTKFNREKRQLLSVIASVKKPEVYLAFDYITLFDYIFLNKEAYPEQQTNSPIHLFSLSAFSRIDLWKFIFENRIVYQQSSTNLIHIPSLIFYNSTNFQHVIHFFTGGRLYTKLGFDIYYQTAFYPDAYNPSAGLFYVQNEKDVKSRKIGNYPIVDVHLTFKIKNVSFFFKYFHANAGLNGPREFTAFHYPLQPTIFSYGINWLFYD